MKSPLYRILLLLVLAAVFIVALGACAPLRPEEVATLTTAATDLRETANALQAAATQPGAPPEIVQAASAAQKAAVVAEKTAAAATRPGATAVSVGVDTVLPVALPLVPEPYQGYLALAGILWGIIERRRVAQHRAASATQTDAIAAAIAAGKLVVQPGATEVVNRAVNGHPSTDKIVDVIAANGGGDVRP